MGGHQHFVQFSRRTKLVILMANIRWLWPTTGTLNTNWSKQRMGESDGEFRLRWSFEAREGCHLTSRNYNLGPQISVERRILLLAWRPTQAASPQNAFFDQGIRIDQGANAGSFYLPRDHLSSIRELVDASGQSVLGMPTRHFEIRTKVSGDLDAEHGFYRNFSRTTHWAQHCAISCV